MVRILFAVKGVFPKDLESQTAKRNVTRVQTGQSNYKFKEYNDMLNVKHLSHVSFAKSNLSAVCDITLLLLLFGI